MIADVSRLLEFIQLRDTIVRARPELAPQMSEPDGRKLTIDLLPTQPEPGPKVVIAMMLVQRVFTWAIVGRAGKAGVVTTAWPTGTSTEELRDAALAVYDACCCEREPESPWR